jgi:hypothetical protein
MDPMKRNIDCIIQAQFPKYNIFEQKFLEPLKGNDGYWRSDTFPNLEEIGMSQYGVFKSLNYINISKNEINAGDPLQHYKNIYFHFGLIFDSIKNLARNICIVGDYLHLIDLNKTHKINKIDLIYKYINWILTEYDNSYKKMTEIGKPIFYYPQKDISYIKLLVPNPLRKKYNKFVTSIMDYRNYYIHTPGVDIIIYMGKLHAIKKEYLPQYRHWSKIKDNLHRYPEHFDDPHQIIQNDLDNTLSLCDSVWSNLIDHMEKTSKSHRYKALTIGFQRT